MTASNFFLLPSHLVVQFPLTYTVTQLPGSGYNTNMTELLLPGEHHHITV